ncbi:MAG: peptide ABC transporter substrate-binding protein [Chloroflexi bacterium]|nr:peptide ABC transporter substrate-binding protein [Chloroflexota bacterium]
MTAPESPRPLPRRGVWRRVAGRVLRRLGLPLLGLALLAVLGLVLYTQQGQQPATRPPAASSQRAAPAKPQQQRPPGAQPAPVPPTRTPGASELRVMLPRVTTLDPGLAYDSETIPVVQLLFEGLLAVDEQGKLGPRGAQRWEVSPDGLTYTFFLDPRARWSDGQAVRADDYVFAWQRNVDPATRSPYAPVLFALKNGAAINSGRLRPDQLGVRARDDQTLVVSLESPAPYFPSLVATWTYFPLRRDLLQRLGERWSEPGSLVGNGPYVLQPIQAGEVVLARNDRYVGPRPGVERIVFRDYANAGQAMDDLRRRELDIMPYSASLKDVIAQDPQLAPLLRSFPRSGTAFLVLNHRRQALQDARVRRALGMALDRAALLDEVTGGAGEVARSLHPPGIAGRDPALWPKEDVAEARRLLAEAGYPDGRGLELVMAVPSVVDPLGRELQQRWKDTLGVTVRLMEVDSVPALRDSDAWRNQIDLYAGSWQSDYEDPYNWFNLLWDSQHDPGQYNSGWRNPDFDGLVRAAQAELNPARRTELYHQAEQIMATDYPLIPLYYPVEQYLVRPEVQGFQPGRTALAVPLLGVSLSATTQL